MYFGAWQDMYFPLQNRLGETCTSGFCCPASHVFGSPEPMLFIIQQKNVCGKQRSKSARKTAKLWLLAEAAL
jgi:hypothetical protein